MTANAPQIPYNIDAEHSVLGAMLLDPKCIYPVLAALQESDFFRAESRVVFGCIKAMHGEGVPIDFVTLMDRARARGLVEAMGGAPGVQALFEYMPSSANIVAYCEAVKGHAVRRSMIAAGGDLAEMGYRPGDLNPDEMTAKAVELVASLQRADASKAVRWGEACGKTQDSIAAVRARRDAGQLPGMATGIQPIDDALGGLFGPKLVLLAARPATGKTAVLNLIALTLAKAGNPGYVASLEMSEDQIVIRGLASEAGLNVTGLAWGDREEMRAAQLAVDRTIDIPLWMDFDTYSLAGIQAQAAMLKAQNKITWMCVDHIGLVETPRFPSRNDQVGFITRSLKQLAKRLQIPVIALSQLSRRCDEEKRRPNLSDLRDSGNIEQDADVVVFLHTPIERRTETVRPLEFGIAKNRQGRTGWNADWEFNGACQRIQQKASR